MEGLQKEPSSPNGEVVCYGYDETLSHEEPCDTSASTTPLNSSPDQAEISCSTDTPTNVTQAVTATGQELMEHEDGILASGSREEGTVKTEPNRTTDDESGNSTAEHSLLENEAKPDQTKVTSSESGENVGNVKEGQDGISEDAFQMEEGGVPSFEGNNNVEGESVEKSEDFGNLEGESVAEHQGVLNTLQNEVKPVEMSGNGTVNLKEVVSTSPEDMMGALDVQNSERESVIPPERTKMEERGAVTNSDHSKTNPSNGFLDVNSVADARTHGEKRPAPSGRHVQFENMDGDVVASEELETGDVGELESSAEDALLSELDAELDVSRGDSPEVDIVANGLTKEAVIEGLVEYQKTRAELQHVRERHKKKSSDLERVKGENEILREQLAEAKQRITSQDSHMKHSENTLKAQQFRNKELEVVIEQHKEDLEKSREKLRAHDAAAKKAIGQLQQELIARVNQVKGMYDEVMKEKETMVLRYAKSEKEVLDLRKAKEDMERKYKEGQAMVESGNTQVKQMKAETAKAKSFAAAKEAEKTNLQKEAEQLKEEVNSQAIKVKWAQNKLKSELDIHKETKLKLSKTEQRLAEAKEETETIRKNCQEMIKQYQESEEVKSNSLGIQLKKTEEEMQIRAQETTDQLEVHNTRLKELSSLKQAHNDATAELESLRVRVKCLEDERIQQEEHLTQFKGLLNNQKEANRKLSRELDEARDYLVQLSESEGKVLQLEDRLGRIQEDGKDLEASLDASREKESELLQFTEKITTKNAELHTEIGQLQSKVESLTEEKKLLQSQLEEITSKHSQLSTDLQREREYREREVMILTTRLNEKSRNEENLSLKLEEAKDEAKTLKRRHIANTKDLTRQLQQAKKRLEALERESQGGKESTSMGSRTSSSGSLETAGGPGQSTPNSGRGSISGQGSETSPGSQSPQVAVPSGGSNDFPGIDKGMLVERIIRLQRLQQKYKEKIEFLQEHNRSLVEVLQKKNKIIQGYVLREETGALTTAASDIHKAQMSKQSGIMASLYRSQATDPRMTLDLSLEINQKLQAVLEDTLLKNITLKENIDTLGREIARLSEDLFNAKDKLKSRRK